MDKRTVNRNVHPVGDSPTQCHDRHNSFPARGGALIQTARLAGESFLREQAPLFKGNVNKAPAFQFFPRDWIGSQRVQLLSLEEEGAYIRLLCHCWLHGSIPADEQLSIKLLGKGGMNVDMTTVLSMFQPGPEPGRLTHERLEAERRKQEDWRNKSAAGGQKSAENRKRKILQPHRDNQRSLPNGANQTPTLQSASASADNTMASAKPPRERNLLLDALAQHAELTDPMKATATLFPKCAKALHTIKTASPDVTPEMIVERARNYATHFSCTISATALANNWGRCEKPNTSNANDQGSNGRGFSQRNDYSGVKNKR